MVDPSGNAFCGDFSHSLTTTSHQRSLRVSLRTVINPSSNRIAKFLLFTANVLPYRYWPLILGACTISQHLSVIFIFLAVFTRLLDHTLDPRLLIILSSATFVVGCIIWEAMEHFARDELTSTPSDRRKFVLLLGCITDLMLIAGLGARTVKASLLVFLALIALAPILRTLTAPTSADSISALTTALFLVHAALADYSYAASRVRRERCMSCLLFLRISKTHRVGKD